MPITDKEWTLEAIIDRLREIKAEGFIPIPEGIYRNDDGIVGQIVENKFGLVENNLSVRDLGTFELKGSRRKSSKLTLCHKTTSEGLTPLDVFTRYHKISPSKRNPDILKRKFFCTINGTHVNKQGLQLVGNPDNTVSMFNMESTPPEFLCKWDLTEQINKIDQIILVIAETKGKTNSIDETFHYTEAWLLSDLRPLGNLINESTIVIDFCIDQPVDSLRIPHDRGPHIRIPQAKIVRGYRIVRKIL